MVKRVIITGFLLLAVTSNSYAKNSDRIDKLEKEVKELQLRVSKLESLLKNQSSTQEVVPSGDGWKSLANWRKLATDMDPGDVRKILGEPQRIKSGAVTTWYYKNGGKVTIFGGTVDSWTEPRK